MFPRLSLNQSNAEVTRSRAVDAPDLECDVDNAAQYLRVCGCTGALPHIGSCTILHHCFVEQDDRVVDASIVVEQVPHLPGGAFLSYVREPTGAFTPAAVHITCSPQGEGGGGTPALWLDQWVLGAPYEPE